MKRFKYNTVSQSKISAALDISHFDCENKNKIKQIKLFVYGG